MIAWFLVSCVHVDKHQAGLDTSNDFQCFSRHLSQSFRVLLVCRFVTFKGMSMSVPLRPQNTLVFNLYLETVVEEQHQVTPGSSTVAAVATDPTGRLYIHISDMK